MTTKSFYVYLLTNTCNKVLYVGMTDDLAGCVAEQRIKINAHNLSSTYTPWKVVYLEETNNPACAIKREEEIRSWVRYKKDKLIDLVNPEWMDLMPVFV